MNNEFLNQYAQQVKDLAAPAQKLAALFIASAEKTFKLQLSLTESYGDLALAQLRAALEVKDAPSLEAFVSNQQKVAKTVSEKLQQDAKTLAGLGQEFGAELQKLAKENAVWLNEALQPKTRTRKAA